MMQKMVSDQQKQSGLRVILGVAIAFFVLILGFSLHRYSVFYADSDHGIFTQVFWNGIHGRFFQSSISSTYSVSVTQAGQVPEVFYHRSAQHFTPALLLWLPVYALFPSPITLIVLKVALLTAAGLVLYALSRQYLSPALSTMIVVSFYGANTVIGPALGEFYDFCQLPLFVFGLLLAMEQRRWWLFGLLAVLTVMVREDAGLGVFGVGLYLILSKRYPRMGLATCALSFAYMLLVTTVVMPIFTDEVSQRFMVEEFGQYTDDQKASTVGVMEAIARRPWRLIQELVSPFNKTLKYLLGQWLPLAFVPALSPTAWILSGFPLAENLLRKGDLPLSVNIRYTTAVVPGLFYGAILWWSHHSNGWKSTLVRRFWILCIGLSLLFTVTSNPHRAWSFLVPDSIQPWIYVSLSQQWNHASEVRSLLSQIPPDASLSATRYIIAHVPNRRAVLRFPALEFRSDEQKVESVDYAMVDFWYPQQYQSAFDISRDELRVNLRAVDRMIRRRRYGVLDFKGGVILLRQGVASEPEAIAAWLDFKQKLELQNQSLGEGSPKPPLWGTRRFPQAPSEGLIGQVQGALRIA